MTQRCGYVAVVGKPNVGKSTLMNSSLGMRLSITTHKPQTTRHRILGVKTRGDSQFVFLDTPGFHLGEDKAINRYMNKAAVSAIHDVDVVLFVIQAMRWTKEEEALLLRLQTADVPVIAVINKADLLADKTELLPFLAEVGQKHDFAQIIPVSAKTNKGVSQLEDLIRSFLPEQPHIFDEDDYTDKNMRFLASERIREQLFYVMNEEIPYSLTVEIEQFETTEERHSIGAVIWVERSTQKGIVIGKGGAVLKEVGTRARKSMSHLFGKRVHLELWVRVKEGWSDNDKALHSLGYGDND
jgi:GTP-binding protein Era